MKKRIVSQRFYDRLVYKVKHSGLQVSSRGSDALEYSSAKFLLDNFDKFYVIMKTIKVKVINKSNNPLPEYKSLWAAGMDLRAMLDAPVTLRPGERALIPSGLHISLPEGYELQVRPRSGLALNHGITLTNAPGTVDADYRGDVGAIVHNLGTEPFTINSGDRICQIVAKEYVRIEWEEVDQLDETARGEGGFNSTGVK